MDWDSGFISLKTAVLHAGADEPEGDTSHVQFSAGGTVC